MFVVLLHDATRKLVSGAVAHAHHFRYSTKCLPICHHYSYQLYLPRGASCLRTTQFYSSPSLLFSGGQTTIECTVFIRLKMPSQRVGAFTKEAPTLRPGVYTPAIIANGFVFTSGVLGADPITKKMVEGTVIDRFVRTLMFTVCRRCPGLSSHWYLVIRPSPIRLCLSFLFASQRTKNTYFTHHSIK